MEKKYSVIDKRFDLCNESNYSNISEIEQIAFNFCKKYNVKITAIQINKRPDNLITACGNDYKITMTHNKKQYSFFFSDSLHNKMNYIRPNCYDVLACIEKYDVGSIDDFVTEFGYEINSWNDVKRIQRIYKSVKHEYSAIIRLFGNNTEEYNELCEIN